MTDIAFYHLLSTPLEQALPKLLEKIVALDKRGVVLCGSAERVQALNTMLWSYDPDSFLPHGSSADGQPEHQPLWLTTEDTIPNGATFMVLLEQQQTQHLNALERLLVVFNGHDHEDVTAARAYWQQLKQQGHSLTYYKQNDAGRWQKEA